MTSGAFNTFPVAKIWVDRAKRQRRELPNVPELAESIGRVGLIHPPVIRRNGELVVGERRWEAIKSLGWTDMPVQFIEDLSEDELRAVELEENVRRVDLPWQDQCNACLEYHELRAMTDPKWTETATSTALGFAVSSMVQRLQVARELRAGNARVAEAPKYSTARNIVQRTNERKRASELDALLPEPPKADAPILHEDFHTWVATYDGPKFNLIHCDFPYGVNADKHDQGAAASHGGYADSEDIYWELVDTLSIGMSNVVDESAHLIFWFSMDFYTQTLEALRLMGWRVDPFPLIWFKADNTGILPDPQRGPRRVYETAFFASRGDRKVVQAVSNCTAAGVTKDFHMSEKPVAVVRHFMRMLCDEYSTVLDPTCGSANALIAARSLRASRVLGLERDEEFHARAVENWRQSQAGNAGG